MKQAWLLAALWAGAAWAQSSSDQPPYVRTKARDTEACLYLKNRAFVYSPDSAGSSLTPGDTEFDAIDAAFATWQAVANTCSDVSYARGPRLVNPLMGYDVEHPDANTNLITFRELSCPDVVPPGDACAQDGSCVNKYRCWDSGDFILALTTTTYSTKTGAIFDADMELHAGRHQDGRRNLFTAVSSPVCPPDAPAPTCVAVDIQNTLTHEIGHAMGLDHSLIPTSTMAATAPPGETSKRILDSGTAQALCDVYPRGQPSPSCEGTNLLRKRIVATSSGTACGSQAPVGPEWMGLLAVALSELSRRRRK